MLYTLRIFLSSKCSLFHNANLFSSCIIHILYTESAKIKKKKNNSGAKRLTGHNAGLLPASLLDITPSNDISTYWADRQSLMQEVWSTEENRSSCFVRVWTVASLRHTHLGSFFLDPEDVRSISLEAIWNFSKGTGFPWLGQQTTGHDGPVNKGLRASGPKGLEPIYYSFLLYSVLF